MGRFLAAHALIVLTFLLLALPALAETGIASWYGGGEPLNERTANGEIFKPMGATCASLSLAFGTIVEVTVIRTGRKARCRINDRGPNRRLGRLIDLSRGVAAKLGMLKAGVVKVRLKVVEKKL